MKVLVADSGSTTTNWALISPEKCLMRKDTKGLNPYYLSKQEIEDTLQQELEPFLLKEKNEITAIYFYGAGCSTVEKQQSMTQCLRVISPNASIFADHDLTAAAKSCCGEDKGIACILGTGSNSCVYDGNNIVKKAISLGYLLGDEGSGTYIGKCFLTALLKKRLPDAVEKLVMAQYRLTHEEMIDHLYNKENPNRFISQFSPFVSQYVDEFEALHEIVRQAFKDFIREFIRIFPEANTYPIHFVGSVAYHLQKILKETLLEEGYENMQRIIQYPIEGLIRYHQQIMA